MPIKIRDESNTLRTIARIRMRDASGVLQTIQQVRLRDVSNILRTVFTGLSASIPASVNTSASTSTITTPSQAVTVVGGTAPYTYLWRAFQNDPTSYNPDGITISTPTASSTTFRTVIGVVGESASGTFECVVTDALGATVVSNSINVTLTRS